MSGADDLLRRYLRQRGELGEREILLERLSRDDLRGRLRAAGDAPAAPLSSAPAPPAPGSVGAAAPADVPAGATAPYPGAAEIVQIGDLDALREVALGCPRCRLSESRLHVVFGEGSPDAEVVVVGEAPGADEDRTGRPFVGRAGQLLDTLLASVGFPREAVYICNVLKCRPPGNRNPQPDEVAACSPYLERQLGLVRPRAILAFGAFAAQTLLRSGEPIGRLRGRIHHFGEIPLVPTYHPAALLRNPSWVRPVWDDLQRLRGVLHRA